MYQRPLALSDLSGSLETAFQYWHQLKGESLECRWEDFDLLKIPPDLLRTTMVIDLFHDTSKNKYRYWGSGMTNIHGRDMTGLSPYDIWPPELAEELFQQHQELRQSKNPDAKLWGFRHPKGFTHVHTTLRLPLSDDGSSVDQIVVAVLLTNEAWSIVEKEKPGYLPSMWADQAC